MDSHKSTCPMSASRKITAWLIMPALASAFALLVAAAPVAAKSAGQGQSSPTGAKVSVGGRGVTNYNWKAPTTPQPVTKQTPQPVTVKQTPSTPVKKEVTKKACCTKKPVTSKNKVTPASTPSKGGGQSTPPASNWKLPGPDTVPLVKAVDRIHELFDRIFHGK
jgi:hypothetical protein